MIDNIANFQLVTRLHHANGQSVYRATCTQHQERVILKAVDKVAAEVDTLNQLRNEYEILSQIQGIQGIPEVVDFIDDTEKLMLIVKDFNGTTLTELIEQQALSLEQIVDILLQSTQILAALHQKNVIHKDIKPANVIWNSKLRKVQLIDFGLAMQFNHSLSNFYPFGSMDGSLCYMPPEQTGRVNRLVDYRSDYYSLGMAAYEMLCQKKPFSSARGSDEVLYAILAIVPPAPHKINEVVPKSLSNIVMRLIAKDAEERYQTPQGLQHDLSHCLVDHNLVLGCTDIRSEFQIHHKVYGREKELAKLKQAVASVEKGYSQRVFVSGFSGVGKTSFVREIYGDIQRANGIVIEGKFEQLQRNQPLFAVTQAFDEFFSTLLIEPDTTVTYWRQLLADKLGDNIHVLAKLLPNLLYFVDSPQEPQYLAGEEGFNRLVFAFLTLIKTIARSDKPMMLFIDDLQWIDLTSKQLIQALFSSNDVKHVLFVGSYRDNEVNEYHVISDIIDDANNSFWPCHHLHLANLVHSDIKHIITDGFQQRILRPSELTNYLFEKTTGNPFFTIQLIQNLIDNNCITYQNDGYWHYQLSEIKNLTIADSVVALMLQKFEGLPTAQKNLLQLAAAIGHEFSLANLALITQGEESELQKQLLPLLHSGFVLAQEQHFVFSHDGIQQAAYELESPKFRNHLHLKIGQHLLANYMSSEKLQGKTVFDICFHLNKCADLITEKEERAQLLSLNLAAAETARLSAAYKTAADYTQSLIALLQRWGEAEFSTLLFAIFKESGECAYLTGENELSSVHLTRAAQLATTKFEKFQIASLRITKLVTMGEYNQSINEGINTLNQYGINLPSVSDEAAVEKAYQDKEAWFQANWLNQTSSNGGTKCRTIAELYNLPINNDKETALIMELLGALYASALMSYPNYLKVITIELVNLSVIHGNTSVSPIGYAWHGSAITAISDDYDDGYAFGQLAINLNENKIKNPAIACKIYNMVGNFISFFKEPLRDVLPTLRHAYALGMESGDKLYGGYSIINELRNALSTGMPLHQWLSLDDEVTQKLTQCDAHLMVEVRESFRSYALQMAGQSHSLNDLNNDNFNEQDYRRKYAEVPLFICLLDAWKIQACYHLGQFDEAIDIAKNDSSPIDSFVLGVEKHFFSTLSYLTVLSEQLNHSDKDQWQLQIAKSMARIDSLAESCPENFLHMRLILQGAIAFKDKAYAEALQLFNKAIQTAKLNNFIQFQALANELAAKLCLANVMDASAAIHIEQAYKLYGSWGAQAKLAQLKQSYPHVQYTLTERSSSDSQSGYLDKNSIAQRIDIKSIMDASLALSSEMDVDLMISRLMKVVLEGSGAQRAVLVIEKDNQWHVSAEIASSGEYKYYIPEEAINPTEKMPMAALQYVDRTGKTLRLNDAINTRPYSNDSYVKQRKVRSVICLPLRHQKKTKAILYIENNLAKGFFTDEQFQRLALLSSQMASAIENSFNYQSLSDSERHYRNLLKNLPVALVILNQDKLIHYANEHALQLLKMSPAMKQSPEKLVFRETLFNENGEELTINPIEQVFHNEQPLINAVTGFKRDGDDEIRWFLLSAFPQYSNKTLNNVVACLIDISERRQHEARIEHLAYFDSLTGLPNRISLEAKLLETLQQIKDNDLNCAVMMLDLDHFKLINDTIGHWAGDEVLKQVSECLQKAASIDDFIARLGGDEFVVVTYPSSASRAEMVAKIGKLAQNIKRAFSKRFSVAGRQLNSTASIGAVVLPADGQTPDEILRRVDSALYESKRAGRNTLSFFDIETEHETQRRYELQESMPEAIEQEQFYLEYQPKVHVESGIVVGAEALVRWRHPIHGFISPLEFISIAEESGAIISLGQWILNKACQQAKYWSDLETFADFKRLSVNVSSVQFNDENFENIVQNALTKSGLEACRLDLEITESLFLADTQASINKMLSLKKLGISFSIDDFGTGYSSLSYLKKLPVDTIKIDQSFVRDMTIDQDDKAIVETIIAIAKNLKLNTVAEGVEEQEHILLLKQLICDQYQGYYFSKPISPEAFENLVKTVTR